MDRLNTLNKIQLIDDLFSCTAHTQVNILMAQKVGLNAAILEDELEWCEDYWTKKRMLTADGKWWTTYQYLQDETGLTVSQLKEAVKKLKKTGIVQTEPPAYEDGIKKKYYKIDYNAKDDFMRSPYDKSVSRSYKTTNFIIFSKTLTKKIGPESTIILRDMVKTCVEAAKRDNLLDGEYFECKQAKIATKIGVTPKTMTKYIRKMISQGIIEVKQASWPKTTYAKIDFDLLIELYGYGSFEEVQLFLEKRQQEKDKKKMNAVEALTIKILEKVKDISGEDWHMSYDKLASIEARLAEGHTEEELLQVVEDRYASWIDDKELYDTYFSWDGVIGSDRSPSTVRGHLDSIRRKDIKAQKKAEAKKVCTAICDAMYKHSKGEIQWLVDKKAIETIRVALSWEEGFTEEDLISFAIGRYDNNKRSNFKMTAFNTLFSKKEKEHMKKARNVAQYEEAKERLAAREKQAGSTKTDSQGRPADRHGVSCTPISQEDLDFQIKMKEQGEVY